MHRCFVKFGWRKSDRHDGGMRKQITKIMDDRGAATAEYVIATMAAVGFAGLLVVILRSAEVKQMLLDMVHNALTVSLP